MKVPIYSSIQERKQSGKKSFAVLVDPDTAIAPFLAVVIEKAVEAGVDYFFVGGSLVVSNNLDSCVQQIK